MYGSDAGQPPRSLYTKGLSPLFDREGSYYIDTLLAYNLVMAEVFHKIIGLSCGNLVLVTQCHKCAQDRDIRHSV